MAGDRTIPSPCTIRFGPFELDTRTAELRKHGIKIRLHEQPFRILRMLLDHPGEAVLRDEIRQALWPNDTVVEFDHSINAAVQRLRDALGDSAGKPRYVETLARRGYRFIGTVEPAEEPISVPPVEVPAPPAAEPPPTPDPSGGSAVSVSAPAPDSARRLWLGWSVLAAVAVGVSAVALLSFRQRPPAPVAPARFQIPAIPNGRFAQLSPDGRKVAYYEGGRLWVHFLESGESRDLTAAPALPGVAFWSPDSRFIGYPFQGKLKIVEASGGPPQTLTDLRGNWGCGAWSPDGVIVFGDLQAGLFRVAASGGAPVQITALDPARHENVHFGPSFLPDGRHFVYLRSSTDEGKSALYIGSIDAKPEQQSSQPLLASNSQPAYAPSADPGTGYLLFVRGGTLMAQPFNHRRLELKGQAVPVAEHINADLPGAAFITFSASANDVLAFRRSAFERQLTWYDREGKILGTVGDVAAHSTPALSPEGTRLAVMVASGGAESNLWLLDLSRSGAGMRFTFGANRDRYPVWSPDGSRIVFSSNRAGRFNLYRKAANGGKDEEVLLQSADNKDPTSWSRDGRFLLYTVADPKTKNDIWVLPLDRDMQPFPFLSTEFNEQQAQISPDGRWVVYTSDESGRNEVYVRSFTVNSAGTAVEAGAKWPISNGLGSVPRWRVDGRELYFYSQVAQRVMAVGIATNPFRAGNPQPLGFATANENWDSADDGSRFLVDVVKNGPQPFTVVMNWQAGLKK